MSIIIPFSQLSQIPSVEPTSGLLSSQSSSVNIKSLSKSPSLGSSALSAYPSDQSSHDSNTKGKPVKSPLSKPNPSPSVSKYQVVGSIHEPSSHCASGSKLQAKGSVQPSGYIHELSSIIEEGL